MSKELRFDGKVVIVTGAGNGLGRSHALLFGSRGAKVVVNDLGGGHTGGGKSSAAADRVVEEIKKAGGDAVANYDSVEDGDKIVKTAIDAFGRIDVIVNNAGILRDVTFQKMTQEDWDLIYRVHVLGAFRVTHAAWPYLRDQKYGRVIFTASAAGIYGNFGQVNYAMAKLGLVGMTNSLALEGRKNNIFVNAIAPIAGSRMTETVLPKELLDALKPEYVSPLVALLSHESSTETGGLFEVGGGYFGKLRWERTSGVTYRLGRQISIEDLKDSFATIVDFGKSSHPGSVAESMSPIVQNVEAGPSRGGNQYIDVDRALGYEFPEIKTAYTERDLSLYALGVGAGRDPLDASELRYVYEMSGTGFHALPTYAVVPAVSALLDMGRRGEQAPGLNFGLDRVLHGEQYTEVMRPLPTSQKLRHRSKIKAIYDKGKGAVVVNEFRTVDENGDLLAVNEVSTFVRGAGGWGGDRGPASDINTPPDRAPDRVIEEKTSENQALLYRLSGDWNPLHVDPGFAKAFGFERPILHGLCTFGYAGRHVIKAFAKDGDARYFKSIRVRFADTVLPGETIVTEMWRESDTRVVFRSKVKERDKVVISNAAVEFFAEIPQPKAKPAASGAASGSAPAGDALPTSADVFSGIGKFLAKNAEAVQKIGVVYQFKLTGPDSVWTIDCKKGTVAAGAAAPSECTLELTDADFLAMCAGKADPMKLFTSGKLKISGNVMASQKLEFLKKVDPADVIAAMQARGGGGQSATSAAAATPAANLEPVSADIFSGITKFFSKNAESVQKIGVIYQFKLSAPDSVWTIDCKTGTVAAGATATPECTLELTDADFLAMSTGKADPMKLFTSGKLKIGGNIMASQKLEFLKKVDPADVIAAMKARAGGGAGGGGAAAAAASAAAATSSRSAAASSVIAALGKKLASDATLGGEAGAVIALKVTSPNASYAIDLSQKPAQVKEGGADKAAATVTISDEDLAGLASGKHNARWLYQHGQLRIDGDLRIGQRIAVLEKLVEKSA